MFLFPFIKAEKQKKLIVALGIFLLISLISLGVMAKNGGCHRRPRKRRAGSGQYRLR